MKKRILAIFIAVLCLTLTACSNFENMSDEHTDITVYKHPNELSELFINPREEDVTVIRTYHSEWQKVSILGTEGFMKQDDNFTPKGKSIPLYSCLDESSSIIRNIPEGTEVPLASIESTEWVLTFFDGTFGYIKSQNLKFDIENGSIIAGQEEENLEENEVLNNANKEDEQVQESKQDDNAKKEEPIQENKQEDNEKKEEPIQENKQDDNEKQEEKPAEESKQDDNEKQEEKPAQESKQSDNEKQEEEPAEESKQNDNEKKEKEPAQESKQNDNEKKEKEPAQESKQSDNKKQEEEAKTSKKSNKQSVVFGIDISHLNNFSSSNEMINYVKEKNIAFVYIRCGGRGYGNEGNMYKDKKWREYSQACEEAGIPYGLYYYSTAITESEAKEEASYILECLKEIKNNKYNKLPIALDVEQRRESRTDPYLTTGLLRDMTQIIINKLKENKEDVVVYSDVSTYEDAFLFECKYCNFWLAQLTENTDEYMKLKVKKKPQYGSIVVHQIEFGEKNGEGVDYDVAPASFIV